MHERSHLPSRDDIILVVQTIKRGIHPTVEDVRLISGSSLHSSKVTLSSAYAWLYREKVNRLVTQFLNGTFKGVKPVARLDGKK
ncbi:hypothetical protein A2V56_03175 [Candidatus Woesebacteria bacterium RBG_19FT_COMBO_42_9]|uniref:Uncharacterized protein n=1 Tax=Candidatus Woesebacteria bacterium RBG_16_42_24 TaxID=1802485 RepID=A0A1F7XLX8_9BACT|nr:MAG: hypothetical protein A2V97_01930 [Candidatus Woesebacteria bacterium RBG_16_42_24]OGM16379.1 MAG: hypothetical protein A2V56_03175 [Candidatus Woesebacteria bacterium RBG_19FT_COMBO_42_9]